MFHHRTNPHTMSFRQFLQFTGYTRQRKIADILNVIMGFIVGAIVYWGGQSLLLASILFLLPSACQWLFCYCRYRAVRRYYFY